MNRGLAHLELGHPDQALPDLERALALKEQPPAVMAAHAEALSGWDGMRRRRSPSPVSSAPRRTIPDWWWHVGSRGWYGTVPVPLPTSARPCNWTRGTPGPISVGRT